MGVAPSDILMLIPAWSQLPPTKVTGGVSGVIEPRRSHVLRYEVFFLFRGIEKKEKKILESLRNTRGVIYEGVNE